MEIFPNEIKTLLTMCGFNLARLDRSKRIYMLHNVENGTDLEGKLEQSKLIVLPINDFPNNLLVLTQTQTSSSTQSQSRNKRSEVHELAEPSLLSAPSRSTNVQIAAVNIPLRNISATLISSPTTWSLEQDENFSLVENLNESIFKMKLSCYN